jgi:tetratricopeptide (TPR) repeat protein
MAMREERASNNDIVVTGTAVRSPAALRRARKASERGDWNACTVNDPGANLAACKKLVDPGASGAAGRAAAHVADGLSRAWRGDTDGAIVAFDQAIGVAPKLAIAWLNRGLAHERKGELDHAIADLDKAVRYAPGTARVYYNRSLLFRQRGDVRRADADAERALDLDARYEAVIE